MNAHILIVICIFLTFTVNGQSINTNISSKFGTNKIGQILPKFSAETKMSVFRGTTKNLTLNTLVDGIEDSPSSLFMFINKDGSLWVKVIISLEKDRYRTFSIDHSIELISITDKLSVNIDLSQYKFKTDRSSLFHKTYGYFEYVELPYNDPKVKRMVDLITSESSAVLFIRFLSNDTFNQSLDGSKKKLNYIEYYIGDDCKSYCRDTIKFYNSSKK